VGNSDPGNRIKAIETRYAGCRFRSGEANPSWKGNAAGYKAVHQRLAAQVRPPQCEECGTEAARFEWALRADAPADALLTSPEGWYYSTNPAHYRNLCKKCHNVQDLGTDECGRGHPLSGDNLYVQPSNGKRFCRTCQRRRRRERTARAAAARSARFEHGEHGR
jgi:hypothetical protein